MINAALEGEEVIITRNGQETVQLVRVNSKGKRNWIGMYDGEIVIHDDFDEPIAEFEDTSK